MPARDRAIVISSDRNYLPPSAVLLTSLARNARLQAGCRVILLRDEEFEPADETMREVGRETGLPVEIVHVLDRPGFPDDVPVTQYLRLLAPGLLPELDRIVYLDCDTLVRGPLTALFDVDLGGRALGAVRDAFLPTLLDRWPSAPDPRWGTLGYFNSGVLVIDVARWNEQSVADRTVELLLRHRSLARSGDQDALNVATAGRWTALDRRWNHVPITPAARVFFERQGLSARADELLGAFDEAHVVHYAGSAKPWQPSYPVTDWRREYLEYTPPTSAAGLIALTGERSAT